MKSIGVIIIVVIMIVIISAFFLGAIILGNLFNKPIEPKQTTIMDLITALNQTSSQHTIIFNINNAGGNTSSIILR